MSLKEKFFSSNTQDEAASVLQEANPSLSKEDAISAVKGVREIVDGVDLDQVTGGNMAGDALDYVKGKWNGLSSTQKYALEAVGITAAVAITDQIVSSSTGGKHGFGLLGKGAGYIGTGASKVGNWFKKTPSGTVPPSETGTVPPSGTGTVPPTGTI